MNNENNLPDSSDRISLNLNASAVCGRSGVSDDVDDIDVFCMDVWARGELSTAIMRKSVTGLLSWNVSDFWSIVGMKE